MAVIVRSSEAFGKRLNLACDRHEQCPDINHGRLVWLRDQLANRECEVSVESVRKWVSGEARPVQDRATDLAKILNVNPIWLYMGAGPAPALPTRESSDSNTGELTLPIRVRTNLLVKIIGLPGDLTAAEAKRIANIILAHAVVG